LATLYYLLNDTKKAEHYYTAAQTYADHHRFTLGISLQSFCALNQYEKALDVVLHHTLSDKNWLAFLYEKVGNNENAQKIYTEIAVTRKKNYYEDTFFEPHFFARKI
jgi:hypothetical protein